MLTSGMRDVNFPHGENEHFSRKRAFSTVERAILHGQPTIFRLFQLYIFLYSAIHKEDTDFRSRISACTCQRVEICDSRDVENAKCQKAAIAFVMFLSVYAAQQEHLRYPPRLLPIVPKDKGHLFSGSISGEPVSCSSS